MSITILGKLQDHSLAGRITDRFESAANDLEMNRPGSIEMAKQILNPRFTTFGKKSDQAVALLRLGIKNFRTASLFHQVC